jgi:hypothetical protein
VIKKALHTNWWKVRKLKVFVSYVFISSECERKERYTTGWLWNVEHGNLLKRDKLWHIERDGETQTLTLT